MSALPCMISRDVAIHEAQIATEAAFENLIEEQVDEARAELMKDDEVFLSSLCEASRTPAMEKLHESFRAWMQLAYVDIDRRYAVASDICHQIQGIYLRHVDKEAEKAGAELAEKIRQTGSY